MQETPSRDRKTVSPDQILVTRIKGTEVYNAEGERLGTVEDIVLDKVSGHADYAIMSFGGFLGIGEKFHPLPWQCLTYDPGRGGYVINASRKQLESAPSYEIKNEPEWSDPEYARLLEGHYGIPLP